MPLSNIFRRGSRKDSKSANSKLGLSEREGLKEAALKNGEGLKTCDSLPEENVQPVQNQEKKNFIDSYTASDQTNSKNELMSFTDDELALQEENARSKEESPVEENEGTKSKKKLPDSKSEENVDRKLESLTSESNTEYSKDNSTDYCEKEELLPSMNNESNVNEVSQVQQICSEGIMRPFSESSKQNNCSTAEETVKAEPHNLHQSKTESHAEDVEQEGGTSIAKDYVHFNELRRNSEKEAFLQRIANAMELEDSSSSVSEISENLSAALSEKNNTEIMEEIVHRKASEIHQDSEDKSMNASPFILEQKESLQKAIKKHQNTKDGVAVSIKNCESYAHEGTNSEVITPTDKDLCAVESTTNALSVNESHTELNTYKKTVSTTFAESKSASVLPNCENQSDKRTAAESVSVLYQEITPILTSTTEKKLGATSLTNEISTASIITIGKESALAITTDKESESACSTDEEASSVKGEFSSATSIDKATESRPVEEKENISTLSTDKESSLISTNKNESDPTREEEPVPAPSKEKEYTSASTEETKSIDKDDKQVSTLEELGVDDLVSNDIPTSKSPPDGEKDLHVVHDASVVTDTSSFCEKHKVRDKKHDDEDLNDVTQVVEYLIELTERSFKPEITVTESETKASQNQEKPISESDSSSALIDQDDLSDAFCQQDYCQKIDSQNWKVGYLQVKLPAKSRKAKLKAWQKRWVVIQMDEFTNDKENNSLMLSIYHSESGNSRKHSAVFWKSISSKTAVVYRSVSKTHPYTFTIAEDNEPVINLAAESESVSQEWMAAMRAILWPPSSVMQLEKVLNGNEFEISIIDNDFSYRAGLLGTYGYMSVTTRKLILSHPQSGHVIQEWYLNTVDKFQVLPQQREEDVNKVLLMHTSSDSSTGCGQLKFFCNEAVDLLKSIATTIHRVLQYHSKSTNVCYAKELAELAGWLTPESSPKITRATESEEYYKVPPRQVRSLLDIPNFIFDMPLKTTAASKTVSSENISAPVAESPVAKLKPSTTCVSTFSQDSGISVAMSSDDFLNCSGTSFTIGNRSIRGHVRSSSTSESSDDYSPPSSPAAKRLPNKKEIGEMAAEA